MEMYQEFNGKRYTLYRNEKYFSRGVRRMHVAVWEFYNAKVPKGFHVHHKDQNTHNNSIDNLELIERMQHLTEHARKRFLENPEFAKEFQKKGISLAPEWHKSASGTEWHSKHAEQMYKKREFVEYTCQECGKLYSTRHFGKTRFCHPNCKARSNRRDRKLRATSL